MFVNENGYSDTILVKDDANIVSVYNSIIDSGVDYLSNFFDLGEHDV